MSLLDENTVDIISTDKQGRVVLTSADHLCWGNEEHLQLLQRKLNLYLAFVEGGEVYKKYPSARDRKFLFNVSCKFKPDEKGADFFQRAKEIIEAAGFEFRYEVFAASYDN